MRIPPIVLLLTSFLPALTRPAESESLRFRFIGNEAFEITDGETTLLTDFPYRSGSFGYMTYGSAELRPRENAVCLVTHRHLDHFDPDLVAGIGCTLVGPNK
jgi:L-ascorbate metabolism protein UlaG (beta-lactamase superfamily)